uniref:NoeD n=1 Tax=Bradyrhizobium japonicum TaxID=375 RepID=P94322_BRAJP|nr:NoeD [Bradyrhizobium diazoefficiens USDA 110]
MVVAINRIHWSACPGARSLTSTALYFERCLLKRIPKVTRVPDTRSAPAQPRKVRYVHEQILAVAIVRPNELPALFNAVRHYCSGAHVCSTVLRLDIAAYYSGAAGALSVPNSAATSASEDERHHLNILTHLASQQTGGADQALEATSPPLTLPHLETR